MGIFKKNQMFIYTINAINNFGEYLIAKAAVECLFSYITGSYTIRRAASRSIAEELNAP